MLWCEKVQQQLSFHRLEADAIGEDGRALFSRQVFVFQQHPHSHPLHSHPLHSIHTLSPHTPPSQFHTPLFGKADGYERRSRSDRIGALNRMQ